MLWLAVLSACIAIAFLSLQLSRQLRGLQEAPADNLQWNVTQLELDVARLENAIQAAALSPDTPLADLRQRFDLFYSRAETVQRGDMLTRLGLAGAATPLIDRMRDFLSRNVTRIDGDDAALRAALPAMQAEAAALRLDMRTMSIKVIDANAAEQDAQRAGLASAVQKTAIAGAVLIIILVTLLLLVLQLNREAGHREQEILRITKRLEATVATALDAVIVADMKGRVIEFNTAAERMFGHSRAEAVGQPLAALIIPDRHIAAHEAGMARMRAGGEKRVVDKGRVDMTARARSGQEFPVELSIASADGPDGTIFIAFLRDISEARAAESALIDARDKATAAEQTKTNFIAVMSHEMRTPLNGMIAALEIIGQGALDARQSRFLSIAQDSSRQLLRHVNDVLEISRIEAGQVPILRESFDLAALLATLVEPMVPQAAERGTVIDLHLPAALPPVLGDPFRLGQIVQNLVSNAVKFTEGGQITVEAAVQAMPGNSILLDLQVRDTGIGIAPGDQARIFEDFVMVDPSYGRKVGGTGLGLAISRRLVRAMGGDIAVKSMPGQGSTFSVRLPMTCAPAVTEALAPAGAAPPALDRPLSVLVVEDNPTNRVVLEEMLTGLGHRVELAVDGAEGVAKARARRFDLVLMDLSMPRVDGWTATTLIRADGASSDSRILAVTAHAGTREDPRFAVSGFDGLLTKPLTLRDLSAVLLGDSPVAAAGSAGAAEPPLLDAQRLGDLARMDRSAGRRLMAQARADMQRCLGLVAAADATPAGTAARLHEAAGVAAVIGAARLHAALQRAEAACKAGTGEEIMQACAPLAALWQATDAELAARHGFGRRRGEGTGEA